MPDYLRPIKPLSDQLINRIAAGEVIERPASVLKELVENSLDANAGHIEIDVAAGGIDLIAVQDDGDGIPGHEMTLALARHCTSKIDDGHDLVSIDSLGFRGEALASIAAVADVTLCSRTRDEAHGWRISSGAGGVPTRAEPHAHPRGTKVEVRGLFHNTPARRRFLKRPQTEYHHIHQLVRRLGFCRSDVGFVLSHDGRRRVALPIANNERSSARRWRQLFGAGFAADALRIDTRVADLHIFGWVGDAVLSRTQSDLQFMAVNGRTIRDRQLGHAIRLAFDDRLQPGKHPAYALQIVVPTDAVDVNVHPGKLEVRFADVRAVHDLLYTVVRRALDGEEMDAASADFHSLTRSSIGGGYAVREERAVVHSPSRPNHTHKPAHEPQGRVFGPVIAVIDSRFALTREETGLRAVDLRDLLRAVVSRRLENAAAAGSVASRPLLVPEAIALRRHGLSEHQSEQLASCGIGIDVIGPTSVVLRSLPVVFPDLDTACFCAALADALSGKADISIATLGRLASESAKIPGSEKPCSDLLNVIERSLNEIDVSVDDFCAAVDSDALQGLVARNIQ